MKTMRVTVAAMAMGMFCAGCGEKPGSTSADKATEAQAGGSVVKTEKPQEVPANNEPITLENYTVATKFVDQGYQGEAFQKHDKGTRSLYVYERHGYLVFLVGVTTEGMIFTMSKIYQGSVGTVVNAFAQKYDLRFKTVQNNSRIVSASAKRGDMVIEIYPQEGLYSFSDDAGVVKVDIVSDSLVKKVEADMKKVESDAAKKAASDFKF